MISATDFRPGTDDWRAIRALNGYRWLVATGAGVLFLTGLAGELFRIMWPALFGGACLAYLILCLPAAWAAHRRAPSLTTQVYLLIGTDIAFVLALVLASHGVRDGLAVLLFAPVAGASMLVRPRMAALFAAIASLGLLAEEGWRYLRYPGDAADWAQAGILGALLFTAAIVASTLARRVRHSDAMVARHKSELDDMTRLNERIIHEMAMGLLVIDADRRIRLSNQAARDFLGFGRGAFSPQLVAAAPELDQALRAWLIAPDRPAAPFDAGTEQLIPRFNRLGNGPTAPILIFLDDARRISEQTQQIKLAALGRLTASIAHEIRNPLSAISHAGQILHESEHIGADERHLLSIQHRHTQRIDDIVQSILGLSRRGRTLPDRFALKPWLDQFVSGYQDSRQQPVTIIADNVPTDLEIQADPAQLEQVLSNLCDNAERHAGDGGADLRIELSAGTTDTGQPCLDIADNGPGIPDDVAPKLMEPFFTTAHDGTGLGLYIARELCQSNFGSLALIESDRGTRFRITFVRPDELEYSMRSPDTDGPLSGDHRNPRTQPQPE